MNTSENTDFINKIIQTLKRKLDRAKFRHSLGVARTARALAEKFNYPEEPAYLAGLLHDFGRSARPSLEHGQISASLAKKFFGIRDKKILQAIQRHTLGAPYPLMTKLDKIIFLADAIAPDRRFPESKKLRYLAFRNLDRAMFVACRNKLIYVLKKKRPLDHRGVSVYNSFLLKYRKGA